MIPDQTDLWNNKHSKGEHSSFDEIPSPFALVVEEKLSKSSLDILDLGCGVGRDSLFFSKKGHKVTAVDLSDIVIKENKIRLKSYDIDFMIFDMQDDFSFFNQKFDLIYSYLALHYFNHETTQKIVNNVHRTLSSNGLFAFACKSVDDFHYGNGEEVEKDVFVSKTGHVRHLFSEEYIKEILSNGWKIEFLDQVDEVYSGQKSSIIRCIARKVQNA